jgi:FkbM family methyltransferase
MSYKNCIIDVGACHNGNVTKSFRSNTNIPIIFIEPCLNSFNKLFINDNDVKLPICISNYDGITKFNLFREGTHSILDINMETLNKFIDGYTGKNSTEDLWEKKEMYAPCVRLDTLIKNMGIENILFLKIDTQGYDFEVIKSAGELIRKVQILTCEVQIMDFELYKHSSKKKDIIDYLKSFNFTLIKEDKQTFDQEENLTFKNMNL